jgi:acetyltransferase
MPVMDGATLARAPCARVRLARPAGAAVVLAGSRRVLVRALAARDGAAEKSFFDALSPASRYRRFLLAARSLSEATLRMLTEIDQHRHVALVAVAHDPGLAGAAPRIVGDARYVWNDDDCRAEFAVAIADDWQRLGLGAEMMRRLAGHARQAGVRELFGHVLRDNRAMLSLALALGGEITENPEDEALVLVHIGLPAARPSGAGAAIRSRKNTVP